MVRCLVRTAPGCFFSRPDQRWSRTGRETADTAYQMVAAQCHPPGGLFALIKPWRSACFTTPIFLLQGPAVHRRSSSIIRITSQLHIKLQTFTLLQNHSRPPFFSTVAALCLDITSCLWIAEATTETHPNIKKKNKCDTKTLLNRERNSLKEPMVPIISSSKQVIIGRISLQWHLWGILLHLRDLLCFISFIELADRKWQMKVSLVTEERCIVCVLGDPAVVFPSRIWKY